MTTERLKELFDDNEDFLKFERVKNKYCQRADLHAFILLNKICPGNKDIIDGADHEIVFLGVDIDKLAENITEERVDELSMCGVFFSNEFNCLAMFV